MERFAGLSRKILSSSKWYEKDANFWSKFIAWLLKKPGSRNLVYLAENYKTYFDFLQDDTIDNLDEREMARAIIAFLDTAD